MELRNWQILELWQTYVFYIKWNISCQLNGIKFPWCLGYLWCWLAKQKLKSKAPKHTHAATPRWPWTLDVCSHCVSSTQMAKTSDRREHHAVGRFDSGLGPCCWPILEALKPAQIWLNCHCELCNNSIDSDGKRSAFMPKMRPAHFRLI